jgi:uncharacterized protein
MINLPFIAQEAIDKEDENISFRAFLKNKDAALVDEKMLPIGKYFTEKIDCTACGNCCKNIMISVDNNEAQKIASALQQDFATCKNKYFDHSNDSEAILINAIPCHFLKEKKCTVYESRPSACASFPHVHLPNFTSRLFSMLDGYGICPIIYHSMEELKREFNFLSNQ